ncbi:hypothetical protein [Bordetella bronchialis]|uniref:Uncharacterized protein n=1 Tax=Bordetella bronchialis TaxID=463025 RepID=A0A193G1T8_9BORD|nr:hypothetical protein [Bordetella bronchialis]ANN73810.1 hypothetical protein BAU08_22825 [Bordetella bronchialis]
MSVFVIPPNLPDSARMLLGQDPPARRVPGAVAATCAECAGAAAALAQAPAAGEPSPAARAGLAPTDVWVLASLLLPWEGDARSKAATAIDAGDPRWMAVKAGIAAAGVLDIAPQDCTPEELAQLGQDTLILAAARKAGLMDEAGVQGADSGSLVQRLESAVRVEFADAIAFYQAMDQLDNLRMPTRDEVARDVLAEAGLNPDYPRFQHTVVDYPVASMVWGAQPGRTVLRTPADRYYASDALSAQDVQALWTRDNTRPTPAQVSEILARLPASLNAEFDARFDAYANQAAAQMAILVRRKLAMHAAANAIDLSSATVSVARPALEAFLNEVMPLRGAAVVYEGKARTVLQPEGYVYTVRSAGAERRFFLSSKNAPPRELPADVSIEDWVHANRRIVFGDAAFARGMQPPFRTRLTRTELAAGDLTTLDARLAAAFRNDIEALREASRGQTPQEQMAELLRGLIPFRETIQAVRRNDPAAAVTAAGVEIVSLIPTLYAGGRLAALGVKLGRQALLATVATMRSPQWAAAMHALGSQATGMSGVHGVARLARSLRDAIQPGTLQGAAGIWGRMVPRRPGTITAGVGAAPAGGAAGGAAITPAPRAAAPADGWWRVPARPVHAAEAMADDAIDRLPSVVAQGKHGGELPLQPYGRSGAYTQYHSGTGERYGPVMLAGRGGLLYRTLAVEAIRRYRVNAPDLLSRLGARPPAADGTIALAGRHYARIGDDYIEIAVDLAVSTAARQIWRAVPAASSSGEAALHRIVYDKDQALWRQAGTPGLEGGGRIPRLGSGDMSLSRGSSLDAGSVDTSPAQVSSGTASPAATVSSSTSGAFSFDTPPSRHSSFSPAGGVAPGKSQLELQPFGHGIRARHPGLVGHARKNYFVQGPDGQVRRFPGGYSGGTVTPELLDGEFVRSMDRIVDYSHAKALGEVLAGYRHDAAKAAVSFRVGTRAVSSYDAARAVYPLREGPHAQYMIPATDQLGDAEACAQMLLAEGKTPAQAVEQVNRYQQLRPRYPRGQDAYSDTLLPLAAQLNGAAVTTYTNGATHEATLQMLQRSLRADAPLILFRKDKAVILDAIGTDAEGTWLTIRHPVTGSQVRIRDHREFWTGDDRALTVTPTTPDMVLHDIRVIAIEHEHRLRHLQAVRQQAASGSSVATGGPGSHTVVD